MGKLSDKAVQAAQPRAKQYGLSDGDGLTLIIKPTGSKVWWFRYRFAGKAKTLSIGIYPVVSLREQRLKNDLAVYEAQTERKAASIDFRPTVFGKYLRILDCREQNRYAVF